MQETNTPSNVFNALHYLRFFYANSYNALGPSDDDNVAEVKASYKEQHGEWYSKEFGEHLRNKLKEVFELDEQGNKPNTENYDRFDEIFDEVYHSYIKEHNYDNTELSEHFLKYYLKEISESLGPASGDIYYDIVEAYEKEQGVVVPDDYRDEYGTLV